MYIPIKESELIRGFVLTDRTFKVFGQVPETFERIYEKVDNDFSIELCISKSISFWDHARLPLGYEYGTKYVDKATIIASKDERMSSFTFSTYGWTDASVLNKLIENLKREITCRY